MDFNYSKEDIEKIAEEYPSLVTRKVKAHDKKLYEHVSENFKGEKFTEKLFRFIYGNEASVCDMNDCKKTVSFLSFNRGFKEFCSRSCGAKKEGSKENVECAHCEKEMEVYESKDQKYCSHECYIEYRNQKGGLDEQLRKANRSFWNDDIEGDVDKKDIMPKEDVKQIAEKHKTHLLRRIKSVSLETKVYIDRNIAGETFVEKVYRFVYDNIKDECDVDDCDITCSFESFSEGYKNFCSIDCVVKSNDYSAIREKAKSTLQKRYGINHPAKTEDYEEKVKKTKKERYGDPNYNNIKEMKKTCQNKYGGVGFASDILKEKVRDTCRDVYGDPDYKNRDKAMKTIQERYGQKMPPKALEKLKGRLERGEVGFGSDNYLNSIREKYGREDIENISQAEEIKNKKRRNRLKKKYKKLFKSIKFCDKIEPLFSFEDYEGVYSENSDETVPKYPFKCKRCDKKFEDDLYSGRVPRCPECDPKMYKRSNAEEEIGAFVEKILPEDQEVIKNDKSVLDGKELDIYIPARDIAIEYNGLYWHSETQGGKDRYYHLNKTEECEDQGIQLIHIFGNEWRDKPDVIKRRLRHILGCSNQNSIYARNCTVKEIDREAKSRFLKKYHLQGAGASRIKLGLFHGEFFNSDLVGVMTFGTPSVAQGHKEDKRKQWEMKRFALSKPVVGGTGKLFKHFVRNYDAPRVKTYADRRWSTKIDNVYEKIGFEYTGASNPNYYYFHKENPILKHRFNFRKDQLGDKLENFDPNLTEWENMQNHDYDRIWDCGHLKYIWEADE